MNEEIDISGCKYAEKSIPVDCSIDNCFCYENKNCYYKQLKRLEIENAMLKRHKRELGHVAERFVEDINTYRKANARLKKALEEIRGINNLFFDMNYGFDEQNISYDVKEVAREIQDKINETTNDK